MKQSEVLSLIYTLSKSFRAFQWGLSHRFLNLEQLNHQSLDRKTIATELQQHQSFLQQYEKRLTQLMRITIEAGIQPILATQPTLVGVGVDDITGVHLETIQLKRPNGKAYWRVLQAYNQITQNVGNMLNIPVIALDQRTPKSSRYFYDALHFTNEGASLGGHILATKLLPYLFQSRFSTPR